VLETEPKVEQELLQFENVIVTGRARPLPHGL
jgi:hypothetical protein